MEKELNAKVLLVDDEEEFIDTLSQRLKLRGLTVSAVTSGVDAVKKADEESFDAILLDLSMPGMDGIETLKRIRKDHPDAEIIIMTGHGSIQTSIEAMKLGAEDYLEKPVSLPDLMEKISEAKEKRILVLQQRSKEEVKDILRSKGW